MRDLAILIAVVVLVYLFQCICWAPAGAQVFLVEAPREGRRKKRGFAWSALRLTAYWANPLPPLQPLVVVDWPEFQPMPEAFTMGAEGKPVSWEQATFTRSGGKVFCNSLKAFEGGDRQAAAYLELFTRLKQAEKKQRQKLIEGWLRNSTDAEAAQKRFAAFHEQSRWLELAVNAQFLLLFVVVPIAFFRFGSRSLWPMLAAVLSVSIFIAWQSYRLHKAFFPADSEAKFKSVLSTVLSPIYAIRALDALARDLLASFHPVAVAGVVCPEKEFEAFAGEQLRANKFSQSGGAWYQEQLQLALTAMLRKKGVEAKRLLAAPERESNCVQYCPRCLAQYTKAREMCSDCGFEQLVGFEDVPGERVASGG